MTDIINLNKARKKKTRADREKRAEANRIKFGRSRAQRENEKQAAKTKKNHLDAHRLDDAPEE